MRTDLEKYFYLMVFLFIFFFGVYWIKGLVESYEPPSGLVVNMQAEIVKKSDKQKELRQGAKFWQHQLDEVRKAIKEPEEVIALSHQLNEIKNRNYAIKKTIEASVEKTLIESGLNTPEAQSRRVARKEIERIEEKLENSETTSYLQSRYDAAVKRQPALMKLEEIIYLKLESFKD